MARGPLDTLTRDGPEDMRDTLEMAPARLIDSMNVVFDDQLIESEEPFEREERVRLETAFHDVRAELVFRDEDLAFIELEWPPASGLAFPASREVVEAVHQRAAELGYPISLLLRRAMATKDQSAFVERHIVSFDPEPAEGDGRGVSLELRLGIDRTDEDYGPPPEAERRRDAWIARIVELVEDAYPRARLRVEKVDESAEDIAVRVPRGLDADDFEWIIEDLIEQATEEILEQPMG